MQYGMPRLAALASAADNICFASSSVRLAYVRGMSPHLNTDRILNRPSLWPGAISLLDLETFVSACSLSRLLASTGRALRHSRSRQFARSQTHEARNERVLDR